MAAKMLECDYVRGIPLELESGSTVMSFGLLFFLTCFFISLFLFSYDPTFFSSNYSHYLCL